MLLEAPDFSVALACLAAVLGLVFVVLGGLTSFFKRSNTPPGPTGFPLFGNTLQFGNRPFITWFEWSKDYGPIFSVNGGGADWIILNSFDSVKQAFEEKSDVFSGRPYISLFEQFGSGTGLFYRDGEHFEVQQKFGLAALAGHGKHKRNIEEPISEEWHKHFTAELKKKTGTPINLEDNIMAAVVNSMCTALRGKRYDYKDEEFLELKEKHNYYFPLTPFYGKVVLMRFFYWLRHLPSLSTVNQMLLQRVKRVSEIFGNWTEEHKSSELHGKSGDFLDEYLQNMQEKTHKSFTKEQLPIYLMELFTGGARGCAATIKWALLYIIRNPEISEKVFEEIVAAQKAGPCNYSESQSKLPFTSAVILESIRCRPAVPISINHRATQDATLMGFDVPKDTQLVSNHWAIHHDPALWEDPEQFNPKRFINEQGEFVPSDHVMPFGYGLRKCVGYKMAEMIVFHALTALLGNFEITFSLDADSPLPTLDESVFNVANQPIPFETILKHRENGC